MAAYSDMNVPFFKSNVDLTDTLEELSRLRYGVVSVNNRWEDTANKEKKKKKDKTSPLESPTEVTKAKEDVKGKTPRVYSRLTVVLNDAGVVRMIQKDEPFISYDVIAVQPTDEKMFNLACKSLDVDVITFDLTERLGYHMKRTALGVAIERGIHIELCYSPMLRDSTTRRNMIATGTYLTQLTKGKNIILSSGCKDKMELRGPIDVVNLGSLFGLSADQAKAAITTNCRRMLLHAESRKTGRGVVKLLPNSEVKVREQWLLHQGEGHGSEGEGQGSEGSSDEDDDESQQPTKKVKT